MKFLLLITELGLILARDTEPAEYVGRKSFPEELRARKYLDASLGQIDEEDVSWIKGLVSQDDLIEAEAPVISALSHAGLKVVPISEERLRDLNRNRPSVMVTGGLATSDQEAESGIREVSLQISDLKIKEKSSRPDLQAMESVQALDEVDKTANIMASRVREWYGLHFPELTSMVDDNISLVKLILTFKTRSAYSADEVEGLGYSKNKSAAIETAARQSRGADLREEDIARIVQIAGEVQQLNSLRDRLAAHVEKTMRRVAPNLTEVAGASIGARLIAKAGGLEKLAILPASTIQILGAERALYRALRSGSRPPKHGILFQHAEVHGAPKWQRGKIARSVAGKIAIAARVDLYRGSRDETVMKSLQTRLEEIRMRYKEAPKQKATPPLQKSDRFARPREGSPPRGARRFEKDSRSRRPREAEERRRDRRRS